MSDHILLHEGSKVGQLKHLSHIEDLIIEEGYEGAVFATDLLNNVFDSLKGRTTEVTPRVKWDGCFAPSTVIETTEGPKSLAEIIMSYKKGKACEVETFDLENSVQKTSPVLSVGMNEGEKPWVCLTLEDDTEIYCTEDHPIYTTNRGYVAASKLTEEDNIFYEKG